MKPGSKGGNVLSPRHCATVLKALAVETHLRILETLPVEENVLPISSANLTVRNRTCPITCGSFGIQMWWKEFMRGSRCVIGSLRSCGGYWPVDKAKPLILAVANCGFPNRFWLRPRLVVCR